MESAQNGKPNGNGVPPKIKVNGQNGNGHDTPHEGASVPPPKITLQKKETARVTVPDPAAASKKDTARIVLPAGSADKKDTGRVVLPPDGKSPPDVQAKKDTARVTLPAGQESPPADQTKKDTARIEVPLEDAEPVAADQGKKQTARIDIADILSAQEPGDGESKTVKPVASRDEADGERTPGAPAGMPKTIRIKRPGSIPGGPSVTAGPETAEPGSEADIKKSATARIEVPADESPSEQPLTRRKTVRIKRPDSIKTGARTLKIARPGEGETAPTLAGPLRGVEEATEVGALFSILALAALLVAAFLVYLLASQVWPGVPFPGKLT